MFLTNYGATDVKMFIFLSDRPLKIRKTAVLTVFRVSIANYYVNNRPFCLFLGAYFERQAGRKIIKN